MIDSPPNMRLLSEEEKHELLRTLLRAVRAKDQGALAVMIADHPAWRRLRIYVEVAGKPPFWDVGTGPTPIQG
ncbi:MAG: hypothetical protein ACK4K7_02950 [Allosphingosinicella sp.]|uniref:hypothetical protein n=1 Tax=Allosphingosinicella sp. TaxID=2823234 RepID=UPI00395966FA